MYPVISVNVIMSQSIRLFVPEQRAGEKAENCTVPLCLQGILSPLLENNWWPCCFSMSGFI
jgi:hypothetical protein